MKISIIQGAFLPVPAIKGGAVEKIWHRMGQEFAALGHEVVHISRAHQSLPANEKLNGVEYKRVKGYDTPASIIKLKWLDLLYSLRAIAEVPDNTDIIVTNTFWAPIIAPIDKKRKVFVSVERMPKGQMRLYRQVACLRANSYSVAAAINREISTNRQQRVVVIPNPLPFKHLSWIELGVKKPEILYVGRVHPEKGLELLIKAVKDLEFPWILRVVGPTEISAGGGGNSYLKTLKKLSSKSNVSFIGPVYDMDVLNKFYQDASIFVYPSVAEQGETFGLAPLEAMAWGCVPIVSSLACFRDFINHEKNGLIFDHYSNNAVDHLKNAIMRLMNNLLLRSNLAKEALKVRQSHSTTNIASQFLIEFDRIIYEMKHDEH